MLKRTIRADFNDELITVYQAYRKEIAIPAVKNQTFVPPFKKERMTWIKPSFLWMMYRCGWAEKEGQEHVLAIQIRREGFEWALENACLSHYEAEFHDSHEQWKTAIEASPVRIQWDPERDIDLQPLDYRSIQIGLSGIALDKYTSKWIVKISDITEYCKNTRQLLLAGEIGDAENELPVEKVYTLPEVIAHMIGASV